MDMSVAFLHAVSAALDFLAPKKKRSFGGELLAVHHGHIRTIGSRELDDRLLSDTTMFASPTIHGHFCWDASAGLIDVVVCPGPREPRVGIMYTPAERAYTLPEWLEALGAEEKLALAVGRPDELRTTVASAGALLQRHESRISGADDALIAKVKGVRARHAELRGAGLEPAARASLDAADAHRQRRYEDVVALLTPYAEYLPPEDRMRLVHAREARSPMSPELYVLLYEGRDELRGSLSEGITGEPDAAERLIRWLASHSLHPLASGEDGWSWLFRDPRDGRLWEQTFPLGSLHGAGPRRLAVIDPDAARAKYGADAVDG